MYKICNRFTNRILSISIVALYYTLLSNIKFDWNMTEEYSNLFMFIGIYYILKVICDKEYRFLNYFFIGVTFAVNFMIKPTYIAPWIAFFFVFVIMNIRNLKLVLIAGYKILIGVIIIFIPIFIYLVCNNAFKDFINIYFILNINYSSTTMIKRFINLIKLCLAFKLIFIMLFFSFLTIIIIFYYKKINLNVKVYFSLFLVFSLLLTSTAANMYPHYLASLFPAIVILVSLFCTLRSVKLYDSILILVSILFVFSLNCINFYYNNINRYDCFWTYQISKEIKPLINKDKENELLVLGNETTIYLDTDAQINFKYFYQYPIICYKKEIEQETIEYIKNCKPKIIVCDWRTGKDEYRDILKEVSKNYYLIMNDYISYYILRSEY